MISRICAAALFALAAANLTAGPHAQRGPMKCPALEGVKPPDLVEYLKGDRVSLPKACVARAMATLGVEKYLPAIKVLVT